MKNGIYKLLLRNILIAGLCCFAPDIYSQTENKRWAIIEVVPERGIAANIFGDGDLVQKLIILWDEYTAECKADTQHTRAHIYQRGKEKLHVPISAGDIDLGIDPDYRGVETITQYREITFEGFIEYLRTRNPIWTIYNE